MDRITKLKKVAAIAVAYYLQQTGCIDNRCNCICNWQRTGLKRHMDGRYTVQSKGKYY